MGNYNDITEKEFKKFVAVAKKTEINEDESINLHELCLGTGLMLYQVINILRNFEELKRIHNIIDD